MNPVIYEFADMAVSVASLHEDIHVLCGAYRTDRSADFAITIRQSDIDAERERSAAEDALTNRPIRHFSDGYLETLAVYRQIAEYMCTQGVLLVHGSCIAMDGEAFLFTAVSGTGKSTHTRLWREMFGRRAVMVNDDKPLLRIGEGSVIAYGTPWDGKHRISNKISVPLKAICILERAQENRIEPITRSEAFPMLLQQTYRSQDETRLRSILNLIDRMSGMVSLYRLGCNMNPEAAEVAYRGMKG